MAKIAITIPGERIVSEFTALVAQPTAPVSARPPDIGLVEISQSTPTELIPGPPGPQGPRGSRWYTGSGAPGSTAGFLLGDQYLDSVTGIVWSFDGTVWVQTATDLTGPQGSPDTAAQVLAKLITVDGVGSGLDADFLDAQTGSWYQDRANHTGAQAISTVTGLQPALDLKAPLASPALTGNPTAPTATAGDNDTSVATTAFVTGAVATSDAAQATALALKAPLASPALTGAPTTPTAAPGTNSTQIASTAFVGAAVAPMAPLASPALTGNPTGPTPAPGDNDTSLATTAFVAAAVAPLAPIASPTFTGDPKAPTPTAGDNDTSLATTAFVATAVAAGVGKAPTYQRILATGTYTPPVGLIRAKVKVVSGGGGGHYGRPAPSQGAAGSGGGGGGEAEAVLTAAQIGASQAMTIGAGGSGGNGATPTTPTGGGTTSFGSLLIASGGNVGLNIASTVGPQMTRGGAGGVGTTGTVLRGGQHGAPAFVIAGNTANGLIGSNGGGTTEGRGGLGGMDTVDGTAGEFGGGGGGTSVSRGGPATNGGAGGTGLILIEEWYF